MEILGGSVERENKGCDSNGTCPSTTEVTGKGELSNPGAAGATPSIKNPAWHGTVHRTSHAEGRGGGEPTLKPLMLSRSGETRSPDLVTRGCGEVDSLQLAETGWKEQEGCPGGWPNPALRVRTKGEGTGTVVSPTERQLEDNRVQEEGGDKTEETEEEVAL